MAPQIDPAALAARIEALLGELRTDARSRAAAEELVRSLMQFYGSAFERTLELLHEADRPSEALAQLAADPLVSGVLVLHDLHPLDFDGRIAHAVERAQNAVDVAGATIEVLEATADRVRLRLTCDDAAAAPRLRQTVTRIVAAAVPEVADVGFDDPAMAPLLQIRRADGTAVTPHGAGAPRRINHQPVGRTST